MDWLVVIASIAGGLCNYNTKKVKGKRVDGTPYLKQWRWRCTFRDAFQVCCLIWPWSHTKLPKIQQVIEHYATQKLEGNADVVDLEWYRLWHKHPGKIQ